MALKLSDVVKQYNDPTQDGIVKKWAQEAVLPNLLNYIEVDGFSYTYKSEDALGDVGYRELNGEYPEQNHGVVNPRTEFLPIFGGTIETDVQYTTTTGGTRMRAQEILRKQRKAALFFDREVVKGDDATDPKALSGLYTRLGGNQVITAGANGATLTLAMVDQLIDAVYGKNSQKVILCNKAMRRKIKTLCVAAAGGAGVTDVGGSMDAYDGVKIEVLDEDGQEVPILGFDETQGSSNACTSILCLHPGSTTDKEGIQGLVSRGGIKHYPRPGTATKNVDLVEVRMGFAIFNGRAAARLKGLTNT